MTVDLSALAKLLGPAAGSAAVPVVVMFALFVPEDEYLRHVADSKSGVILELVDRARAEPDPMYRDSLCRALQEQIGELCASAPDHSLCQDRRLHLERAGCL